VRLRTPIDIQRFYPAAARAPSSEQGPPGEQLHAGPTTRGARAGPVPAPRLRREHLGLHGRPSTTPELDIAAETAPRPCALPLSRDWRGRASYIFHHQGGDGWITPSSYAAFEATASRAPARRDDPTAPAGGGDLAHTGRRWGWGGGQRQLAFAPRLDKPVTRRAGAPLSPGSRPHPPRRFGDGRLVRMQCRPRAAARLGGRERRLRSSRARARAGKRGVGGDPRGAGRVPADGGATA